MNLILRVPVFFFHFYNPSKNRSNINNILLICFSSHLAVSLKVGYSFLLFTFKVFYQLLFSTFVKPGHIHVKEKLLLPLILFSHHLQLLQTSFSTLPFMMSYFSLQLSSVSHFCTVINFADLPTLAIFE